MHILITGSNGFVGSRLMWKFEEMGHTVHGIDNKHQPHYKEHPHTILGDIRNKEDYFPFTNIDIDLVIHCAASKHDFGITDDEYFSNNEYGTKVLMDFAEKKNIKKIIYFSSVAVYGYPGFACNEDTRIKPNQVYGESKLAGEYAIEDWMKRHEDAEVVFIRPSVIYGPFNYANMHKLIHTMHVRPWVRIGNGDYVKSTVYVENVVAATIHVFGLLKQGLQIFNCADEPAYTMSKLMKIISLNKEFSVPKIEIPLGFAIAIGLFFDLLGKFTKKDYPINSDRMRKLATPSEIIVEKLRLSGFKQPVTTEEAMKQTCQWYLSDVRKSK